MAESLNLPKITVYGRVGGWAVCVSAFKNGDKFDCVLCYKKHDNVSDLIAHCQERHYKIVCGGYPPRDAGV